MTLYPLSHDTLPHCLIRPFTMFLILTIIFPNYKSSLKWIVFFPNKLKSFNKMTHLNSMIISKGIEEESRYFRAEFLEKWSYFDETISAYNKVKELSLKHFYAENVTHLFFTKLPQPLKLHFLLSKYYIFHIRKINNYLLFLS